MAEEFVRKEHFEEFSRRMDERVLGVEKQMEQGFAHAEKAREQNLVHVNQRFDDMNRRFDDMNRRFDDMNRSMNQRFDGLEKRLDDLWKLQVVMLGGILAAAIAAVVKVFFFSS